jgi:hypothetical protein
MSQYPERKIGIVYLIAVEVEEKKKNGEGNHHKYPKIGQEKILPLKVL